MSFFNDNDDFSKNTHQPVQIVTILVTLVVILGVILVGISWSKIVVKWWRKPNKFSFKMSLPVESNAIETDFDIFSQLLQEKRNAEAINDQKIALRLDDNLLKEATTSASSQYQWFLELEIDGEWNRLKEIGGWKSLSEINPQLWRYLLTYQPDRQRIMAFDLRTLEEIPIMNLDKANFWLERNEVALSFSAPPDEIEMMGIVEDKIYLYLHNQLDEGVMMVSEYDEQFENWYFWPNMKGKVAKAAGQSLFLQGYQDGCASVYSLARIKPSRDESERRRSELERIATIHSGCVNGDRFLGVDSQGRILLSPVIDADYSGSQNLDLFGHYQDIYGVPILAPADKARLLMTSEMPSNVHQIAFFPSKETDWREREQLILVNEDAVWMLDVVSGELKQIANLMNMFGKPMVKSWKNETLCLEMIDRLDLSLQERLISIDLNTGVPVSDTEVCLWQTEEDWPYVKGMMNREEKEWQTWSNLELPEDFRMVRVNQNGEIEGFERKFVEDLNLDLNTD